MIIGLIWIIVSAPIWIILSLLYLIVKFFYLIIITIAKIVFSILKAIIKGFQQGSDYNSGLFEDLIGPIIINILMAFYNFFSSINDVLIKFWEFGRYDHPYWALIISLLLLYIYYKIFFYDELK